MMMMTTTMMMMISARRQVRWLLRNLGLRWVRWFPVASSQTIMVSNLFKVATKRV